MTARFVVICGLPGCGKTTLAKQLEASMPAVRFCPDEMLEDLWDVEARAKLEAAMWDQSAATFVQRDLEVAPLFDTPLA